MHAGRGVVAIQMIKVGNITAPVVFCDYYQEQAKWLGVM